MKIIDARNERIVTFDQQPEDSVVHTYCPFCKKKFLSKSVLMHFAKSKLCKPKVSKSLYDYFSSASTFFSSQNNISKSEYDKKRHQRKRTEICTKKAKYYQENKSEIKKRTAKYKQENKSEIKKRNAQYKQENKAKIAKLDSKIYQKKQNLKKICNEHQKLFGIETSHHPVFPCICCHRDLYPRSVVEVTETLINFLTKENLMQFVTPDLKLQGKSYICRTCKKHLLGSKMPPMCIKNALGVSERPLCMKKLKQLEKQLIKKSLPFIKIRQLPKTRMEVANDRIINVQIPDDDIVKTVTALPRTKDNDGFINLKLKRKMEYKTYHKFETVRPDLIYEALLFLKENHPEYKDVKILPKDEFIASYQEDEEILTENLAESQHETDDSQSSEEEEDLIDETDNVFNSVTSLCPEDPTADVIVNTTEKTIKKKTSKKSSTVYECAPGEGRCCNNWARDKKFEITAFPHLLCDGENHFHSERELEIKMNEYFCQRICHHSGIFAEDSDYVFCADQLLEKTQVEKQIDVSARKGKIISCGTEKKLVNCEDAFSIFRSLPGTPSYWRTFRNEMLARIEQLGPFDFFFTLSSAEMRWPEVLAAVLQKKGHKVTFETVDQKQTYMIDGMTIEDFKEKKITNVTELLKDHYVLITRMFDNR